MNAGFYGKMPCKGDFVSRGLPRSLIDRLDGWLQQGLLSSKEQLGDEWLERYLVSPVWYGYLGPGAIDHEPWLGVMVPSVDRVGRYFPLLILLPLGGELADGDAFYAQLPVLREAEELLLDSLEDGFDFDHFCQAVDALRPGPAVPANAVVPVALPLLAPMHNLFAAPECWRGVALRQLAAVPCLWASDGAEDLPPQLLLSDGLPRPAHFSHLLTGAPTLIPE